MNPAKNALGGVPTRVAMPPMLHEYAMISMRLTVKCFTFLASAFRTSSATDNPIGSIISAVAVLLTHMLRNAAAIMNPARIAYGCGPILAMMRKARRRCRFHRCMPAAIRNPPRKRNTSGFA